MKRLNEELSEFKKVKGIASALIDMMKKVEGRSGNLHDAWKWVKNIVWEHETIKKKAL